MGSETTKLPTIDFSKPGLKPGTPEWDLVKDQLLKVLEEFGCFTAVFDKIPLELQKSLIDSLDEVFDLPLQTKVSYASKKPFRAYIGQYPALPLYESIAVDDPNSPENVDDFTGHLWPEGNPTFSKTVQSFAEQLSELDKIVRRMILESLGLEKYMDEHLESTNYNLRVTKYKGPETTEPMVGLQSHTDKNIITILSQNEVQGLEVLTKDGQWIDARPSPGSYTVMVGDSLHAWTNGRLHSSFHRVMMTGNETRYSIGLASVPKEGYMIKAPEELVDEEHPLLYKPFEYLPYYLSVKGHNEDPFPLKAFCGV